MLICNIIKSNPIPRDTCTVKTMLFPSKIIPPQENCHMKLISTWDEVAEMAFPK